MNPIEVFAQNKQSVCFRSTANGTIVPVIIIARMGSTLYFEDNGLYVPAALEKSVFSTKREAQRNALVTAAGRVLRARRALSDAEKRLEKTFAAYSAGA